MSALPNGWTQEPLAKLGTWTGGGTPSTTNADFWTNGTIPWVSPKDMKQRRITTAQDSITEAAVRASTTNLIPENSVMLVTRSGILRHSLPAATNTQPVTLNQDMKALTPLEALLPDYLYYAFRRYERDILHGCCKGGTTVQSIEAPRLMAFEIPIAPLAEQRRIVGKVEELFSELDEGVANLKQARAQLAVYRQALLKHAFEGHLTADWRTKHAPELESANQLLARIRAKHCQRFTKAGKYTAPSEPETEGLPAIPEGWAWARMDLLGVVGSGMSVSKDRNLKSPVEVPYLRVANVQRGHLNLAEMKTMKVEADALNDLKLQPGDILFNEGGDRDKLGRGWVWDGQIDPCITQNHVFRVTPLSSSLMDPKFVSLWGNTFGQQFFLSHGKQTTNLASINKTVLSSLPVPVPSYAEQLQIVSQIEAQTSVIDALEADIDLNLQKAEALRQSILKKAFAGELVPQDLADEPAAALLARTRAEREAATARPKAKQAGKRPAKLT